MSFARLFRQIVQNNPPIIHLDLSGNNNYSDDNEENAGEIILEALVNSQISSIQNLQLGNNKEWFNNGNDANEGVVDMLVEVISKQSSCLQTLNLFLNEFSGVSTEKIVSKIADCGVCGTLEELNFELHAACFDSDESVRKLA